MTRTIKTALLALLYSSILYAAAPAPEHTITIAGTADLQGMMEPATQKFDLNFDGQKEELTMGGIARIATVFRKLKNDNPATLTVSTGDDLMNRFFHTYRGKAIFSLMSDAGYDLYVFGNHEFDKGSGVLSKALDNTEFEVVCSDLDVSRSALKDKCHPYLIKELDGVKVGLFSLMTENFPVVTAERNVTMPSDNVATAKKMVETLRDKGADLIIALSHIGYKEDRKLAKQIKGIDLIFGGHSHHYVKKMGHINNTAIVNGGEMGSQVVKVDIPMTKDLKVLHKEITMQKIPVTDKIEANKKIEAKVAAFVAKFPAEVILGQTKGEWDMHSRVTRKGESPVAEMINDMMRKKFKVDIVLNNGGAFRGNKTYKPGPVTDTMLKEIDEFRQYAITLRLQGRHLKDILEWSAASYGEGGFLQPSGIRYRITLPKQPMIKEGERIIKKGERIDNIKVLIDGKWQAVDPEREYKILSNSFMVEKGGDGYFWFQKYGTGMQNTFASFYSIMADFLYKEKILTPGKKDGRIEIVY
ncbi:MAG: bifunctional UDP-sugar hydrolase/5'-nucleotidase [Campylobacterota bacterium]|nr:bifunctional UDP-sugar hydrolase/5'-nucleotidase [Campylobacterota bacterium]